MGELSNHGKDSGKHVHKHGDVPTEAKKESAEHRFHDDPKTQYEAQKKMAAKHGTEHLDPSLYKTGEAKIDHSLDKPEKKPVILKVGAEKADIVSEKEVSWNNWVDNLEASLIRNVGQRVEDDGLEGHRPGKAQVECTVDSTGKISHIRLVHSSGNDDYDKYLREEIKTLSDSKELGVPAGSQKGLKFVLTMGNTPRAEAAEIPHDNISETVKDRKRRPGDED